MTKIDIVSGFLGAGKTTLIKKLLKEALCGQKVVLIENEFGEIGIDGGFLKDAGIQITEMNSGCICCSLVGDFGKALKQVVNDYDPDRIIIEPSGVGKLSDVIAAVMNVSKDIEVEMNSFTTVADVSKCKMYMKNFGEFYNNQIESANTIVLSRTQGVSDDKLNQTVEMIKEKNPKAKIITTPWDDLTGNQILDAMQQEKSMAEELMQEAMKLHIAEAEAHEHEHHHEHEEHEHHHEHEEHEHHHEHEEHECGCGHHHHHHADEVFTSWGNETARKYTNEELEGILTELCENDSYGIILRAKGMLPTPEGKWLHFDLVPGEHEIREGLADYTGRFCVIGSNLDIEKLTELFKLQ